MSSGGQVYLSMEEIELAIKALSSFDNDNSTEVNDSDPTSKIVEKLHRIKMARLGMKRPPKFLNGGKNDTPLSLVYDQLTNNSFDSDESMLSFLLSETSFEMEKLSRVIKETREQFLLGEHINIEEMLK